MLLLEYRFPRDRKIAMRMNRGKPFPGDQGGIWNARFYRDSDMTNDEDLRTDPRAGTLYQVKQVREPVDFAETRVLMADGGSGLSTRKYIEQLRIDIKAIER